MVNNITNEIKKKCIFFQFGISIIAVLLEQAECIFPINKYYDDEWSNFIDTIMKLIDLHTSNLAPDVPIIHCTLYQHLSRFPKLDTKKLYSLELLLTREQDESP